MILAWWQVRHEAARLRDNHVLPWVREVMPRWLVVQALIKAAAPGKGILRDEVVPEVPFMLVFERWHDAAWRRGPTPPVTPGREAARRR